ncbi:heme-thiolate peroxidase [Stylonectria norvegica]|nr:heme-thiolate peroxidase [Stylonectria norvegica]
MASRLLILLLAAVGPSLGMCPYKRSEDGSSPDIPDHKLAEIFARINENLPEAPEAPEAPAHLEDKRASGFDEESQRIDVSGKHAWKAPGPGDIRGPCPGLNALSNHGYYSRSGVVNLLEGAQGVADVYGLAPNFGIPLSLYAVLVDGDPLTQTWSIGGAPKPALGLDILGKGDGLSGSHNKYEGDASPGRGDYYLYDGDVTSLKVSKFKALYDLAKDDEVPNYNLDVVTKHREFTLTQSKETNPYFFWPPFAGLAVSNAAHTFIPALMSNHSAEYPDGILSKETLKSFFAITENSDGTLTHQPGHERIPIDALAALPSVVSVGGNTGKVNTFTGVDLGEITGGVYNGKDLLNPAKFTCFFYQIILAGVPDVLRSRFLGGVLATSLSLLSSKIAPFVDPESNYNDHFAKQFPGAAVGKTKR